MNFFIFLLLVLAVIGGLAFFYKKFIAAPGKPERVLKEDPAAREHYHQVKHKEEEKEQNLSLEERVELSWQFLKNVKDKVLNHFSAADRTQVQQQGEILNKNGMTYQHNVELEIKQNISHAKSISKDRKQDKGMSR